MFDLTCQYVCTYLTTRTSDLNVNSNAGEGLGWTLHVRGDYILLLYLLEVYRGGPVFDLVGGRVEVE